MTLGAIKSLLPWQAKIIAKMALSRLPVSYRLWSGLGLFRHGAMDDYSYAWGILKKHSAIVQSVKDWRGLELGPGDGLLSCLLAPALHSSGLTLLDVGDYAHRDINRYKAQIDKFIEANPEVDLPDYSSAVDISTLLEQGNGHYLCGGLASLQLLEAESFDLIFSQAVLEHIQRMEFPAMMYQCYRLLKPNGVMSHVVDFRDHLGGGLNNLRIPSKVWERPWFAARSGFYTNRLRLSEIKKMCEQAGFLVEVQEKQLWSAPPIQRAMLAPEFTGLTDEDLSVSGAFLIMRRQ